MEESVSYVYSTGALICVPAICLAFIVSYLVLKSRGRVNRREINHGEGSTSVPLCKVCHQLMKNAPSQDCHTKEWMCSACSGYSHSTEVRKYVENVLTLLLLLHSFCSWKNYACCGTGDVDCLWHGCMTNTHWVLFMQHVSFYRYHLMPVVLIKVLIWKFNVR